jgi:hydrogenase/urease accessory protein HupE
VCRTGRCVAAIAGVLIFLFRAAPASAHPAPFSYLDLRVSARGIDATLVAHVFDLAHELGVDPAQLLDPVFAASHGGALTPILVPRLRLTAGGTLVEPAPWSHPQVLVDRQAWSWSFHYDLPPATGALTVSAELFPYDEAHQTFVNVYENGALTSQAILSHGRQSLDYYTGTRAGIVAVAGHFVPAGIHHILIGPDHLLFLVGLLLLGGSFKRLALVVTAFTLAHSVTLSVAVLGWVTPPARLVEPAIALSIIYIGADNLLRKGGRDTRAWIALAFGLVHGFGFANVLREMDLPRRALGWSLFSFNAGVEVGQLAVVAVVAVAIGTLRARSPVAAKRLAVAGSVVVVAAGAFWFVERVVFPGGVR